MELVLIAFIGWLVGILLNRVADTLLNHRVGKPFHGPQCAYCGAPLPWVDQVGVLSFLLFRGRCPNCRAPISLRVPVVEIASAAAFAFLWTRYGPSARFVLTAVYTAVFLLVMITDLEHRLIFNVVILPATVLAILASPLSYPGVRLTLLGGAVAYVVVYLIYIFAQVFARLRKHAIAVPFGFGDVKLAGFVGFVTAFPAVFSALLLAILLGGAGAIAFLLYQGVAHRRLALGAAIPYGPFFCIAGWVLMVFPF